jgi:hypothetical protein
VTVAAVAREVGRQLGVPVAFGERVGSEAILDPRHLLPSWRPRVSLEDGIARVIAEARGYLASRPAAPRAEGDG